MSPVNREMQIKATVRNPFPHPSQISITGDSEAVGLGWGPGDCSVTQRLRSRHAPLQEGSIFKMLRVTHCYPGEAHRALHSLHVTLWKNPRFRLAQIWA